ncbi:MAG: transcription-repair coupling factor, partial [Oscillospiraceae bacterium]
MKFITEALNLTGEFRELSAAVKNGKTPAVVTGVSGIHKCTIAYGLAKAHQRKLLVLSAEEGESTRFAEDLRSMGLSCVLYPLRDFSLRDTAGNSHEYERQRLEALNRLARGDCDCVLCTIDAALQRTIPKKELIARGLAIATAQELSTDKLLAALYSCGYQRAEQIDGTGQFSHRGGIIDFFPPGMENPVRIEFWGDEIDSISYFDLETQRRGEQIPSVTITPSVEVLPKSPSLLSKKIEALEKQLRGKHAAKAKEILEDERKKIEAGIHIGSMDKFISLVYDEPSTLFDYFAPEDSLLVFSEGSSLKEKIRTTLWQWGEDIKDYFEEGVLCRGLDTFSEDW